MRGTPLVLEATAADGRCAWTFQDRKTVGPAAAPPLPIVFAASRRLATMLRLATAEPG